MVLVFFSENLICVHGSDGTLVVPCRIMTATRFEGKNMGLRH